MRVLVTGAARAIGAATARILTNHGCEVIATSRNADTLDEVPAVLRRPLDVTSEHDVVGEAIWQAITTDSPKLRWPVGADAELVLATRAQLDDEAFEAAMRQTLGLTW